MFLQVPQEMPEAAHRYQAHRPIGRTRNFQMNIMAPPHTIPLKAPCRVERFQNSARSTSGPKEAPILPRKRSI